MTNPTHVQEENVYQAQSTLEDVEAYGTTSSSRTEEVSAAQTEAKWSSVQGADRSSQAMRKTTSELANAMKSMAESTAAFCRLIEATRSEFQNKDEQGQQEMAAKMQELADMYGSGETDMSKLASTVKNLFGPDSAPTRAFLGPMYATPS